MDYEKNSVRVSLYVRHVGLIELRLIKPGGDPQIIYSVRHDPGLHIVDLDLIDIAPGLYHLIMYNDDRVAHFQELVR